jgi:GDPmannose 4,6-dehydratase
MKKALIIGANGQDASYLAELLVNKNYEVHGTIRRNSVPESQTTRIAQLHNNNDIQLSYADLLDPSSIDEVVRKVIPDEIYHLGAQSHVRISFDMPKYTMDVNCGGTLNVLESVKKYCPQARLYNAASSEMYGNCIDADGFQRESTKMVPVSPYGCSKLFAYNICNNYRNAYNLFISSGILFNHESPRRGINFVTNKVVTEAVKIKKGKSNKLSLGNLQAKRDWGHAKDYVFAMWSMLQQDQPKDYVIATGRTCSVQYLVDYVFGALNLNIDQYLTFSHIYERPEELNVLCGDYSLANIDLGWKPEHTLESTLDEMIEYSLNNK